MGRWSRFWAGVKEAWETSGGLDPVREMTNTEIFQDKEDEDYARAVFHSAELNYQGWLLDTDFVFDPKLGYREYTIYDEASAKFDNKTFEALVKPEFIKMIKRHPKRKIDE